MKVLFLPNWRINIDNKSSKRKLLMDFIHNNDRYWFFKYWPIKKLNIDIIDCGIWGNIEKKLIKAHIIQAIIAFFVIHKYDIIISHGGQSALFLALLKKLFFRNSPPHVLIDIASINGGKNTQPILALCQYISTEFDLIIYHAKMQEKHYKKYFNKIVNRSSFIPFGVDINFFNPTSQFVQKARYNIEKEYILSFGYRFRDWATLIEAYKLSKLQTMLIIIGPSSIDCKLPPNVILLPRVNIYELISYIQNSKFVVIPLSGKNYAHGQMSILQTMALGKPVITSDSGAIADYLEDGKNALLYSPFNSESLSSKIQRMNCNKDLRENIGMSGMHIVKEKFNEKRMGKNIFNAVYSLFTHS